MTVSLEAGSAGTASSVSAAAVLPAQLAPFAHSEYVRTRYPVVLLASATDPSGAQAVPLADLLASLLDASAVSGSTLLADNLTRLESWVRAQVRGSDRPIDTTTAVQLASEAMLASLGLAPDPEALLRAQLQALISALPQDSRLLPYLPTAGQWLLAQAARPQRTAARSAWRDRLRRTRNALSDLLAVEAAKDPQAVSADGLTGAVGGLATAFMDPAALSAVVGPARGGSRMSPDRRSHLGQLLDTLDGALSAAPQPVLVLVGGDSLDDDVDSVSHTGDSGAACDAAGALFDRLAATHLQVVGALRAAGLELDGAYDSAQHDAQVAALDWWHLGPEELAVLPVVAVLVDADAIVRDGMAGLTGLIGSGRPVQVVVDVQATSNPGAKDGQLSGFRVELGRLGMGLGQALVQQSTPALPGHITDGLQRSLSGGRAGLHLLCSGFLADGSAPEVGAWLVASSAVESRAHPLFCYDPDGGDSWADCLDAADNPKPETDWVLSEDSAGDVAYTFAHHALLDPRLAGHFRPPTAAEFDSLVPVAEWLELDAPVADTCFPVVTASVDQQTELRVVSEELTFTCRDRMRSWRALRELAGFRNAHALRAAQIARAEAEERAEEQRAALAQAHQAELALVRAEAAADVLGRLAAALVDANWSVGSASAGSPLPASGAAALVAVGPGPADATASAPKPTAVAEESVAEEAEPVEEAWVDAPLCTSCNDCIDVNRVVFAYDGNKQAQVVDASAGTFEEMVRAAEGCPARCIHPGAPLNSSEPGLDDLIARAARFN